jgi:hypothetical protein
VYAQVPVDQPTETAARARVLIGVCKAALGQNAEATDALLAAPAGYDAPELCAFALVEAAHLAGRGNQPEQAEKLMRRVVRSYPNSLWAKVAQQRLKTPSEAPPHELPAAVTLLTPETKNLPPLEMLGQQQSVRSALDDAVEAAYQSAVLSRKPPERVGPAPFIRLAVPDPFEHQHLIPLRIEQAAERLPNN